MATQGSATIKALLAQRLELLRQLERDVRVRQQVGQATAADVQRAVIAVIRADLDLEHSRAEQGFTTDAAVITARLERIEAQISLEREKLGAPAPRP